MKLQPDKADAVTVTAYGPGWLQVGGEKITTSVILGGPSRQQTWPCTRFDELNATHFETLAALDAELILFGSGRQLRFPPPGWLRPLMAKRIGVETMDTAAACRTYNILVGEGRRVVAALLLEN